MINFYNQSLEFKFPDKIKTKQWLKQVVEIETKREKNIGNIAFIFCSDDEILEVNSKYLNHNYLTDVITFNYNDGNKISGDVFIGLNTVKENSEIYSVTFEEELRRVIVHSVLHLLNYDDATEDQQKIMRGREDYYLSIF